MSRLASRKGKFKGVNKVQELFLQKNSMSFDLSGTYGTPRLLSETALLSLHHPLGFSFPDGNLVFKKPYSNVTVLPLRSHRWP